MIRNRMKKLGAFAIAAMMAASAAPALTAASYAAEDDAAAVTIEEETADDETVCDDTEEIAGNQEAQDEIIEEDGNAQLRSTDGNAAAKAATTNISIGKEYSGSFAADTQRKLTFTTTGRNSYYEIRVTNTGKEYSSLHAYLYKGSQEIDKALYISRNTMGTIRCYNDNREKLVPNTKYTLVLKATPYDPGNYRVQVREITDDMGNNWDEAKAISEGTINGTIEVSWGYSGDGTDEDWMRFQAPSAGTYRVTLKNQSDNTGSDIYFYVYDKNGARLYDYSSGYAGEGNGDTKDYSLKSGQVICFCVSTFSGGEGNKYSFSIRKLKNANTMAVKGLTKKVKKSKVRKAAQKVKAIRVRNAKGALTYQKISGSKKLSVNKRTGKITIKKKTKKGTYTMKVKVTAAGTGDYYAKAKTVKVTIKVK